MKRFPAAGFLCALLLLRNASAAEGNFTSKLSPAERAAAGLTALTPEQLARLDALVEAYKQGALAAASATPAPRATTARSSRGTEARPAQSSGLIAQAKDWMQRGKSEPAPMVESTLAGKFRGWEPRQVFTLTNGERWQIANNESYYTPALESPRVTLSPAATGGYWLRFPDLNLQVRVKPLE